MRRRYQAGMRAWGRRSDPFRLGTLFHGNVTLAQEHARGTVLFEQRADRRWVYSRGEISELFALSAYRDAVLSVEEHGGTGIENFCLALEARPDVILEVVRTEGLAARTLRFFNEAKRKCLVKGGWVWGGKRPPNYSAIDDLLD